MRLRPAARRPGLSLLEVLGATAIFLLSIVAIGELMNSSTDQAQDVQFRSRATRLCQSKLNEFSAGVEQVSGSSSGTFDEEPAWEWRAEVTSETTAVNLYRVKVTVSRETSRGLIEVRMTQLIFDPQQRGHITATQPAPATTDPAASGSGSTGSGAAPGAGGGGGSSPQPKSGAGGFGGGIGGGGGFGGGGPPAPKGGGGFGGGGGSGAGGGFGAGGGGPKR